MRVRARAHVCLPFGGNKSVDDLCGQSTLCIPKLENLAEISSVSVDATVNLVLCTPVRIASGENTYTVKSLYNNTIGSTTTCCYNQVAVVTSTFRTENKQFPIHMCVVVERVMLYQDLKLYTM